MCHLACGCARLSCGPEVGVEAVAFTTVPKPSTAKTAWVPFRHEIGWTETATAAAVAWTEAECSARGVRGLLLVNAYANDYDRGPLGSFAERHSITTQRSYHHPRAPHSGVVLVYAPLLPLMELAIGAVRSALCAVEWPNVPLIGWAMETSATDLLTGEVTADTRTEDQLNLLDHLKFIGNNGWHDNYAKRDAPKILAKLLNTGIDPAIIWGAMLARGASATSIEQLQRLANKAPAPRLRSTPQIGVQSDRW